MTEQKTDFDIYENEYDFIKWAVENKDLILEIRASEMTLWLSYVRRSRHGKHEKRL